MGGARTGNPVPGSPTFASAQNNGTVVISVMT